MQTHRDPQQPLTIRRAVITIGSFDGVHRGHRRLLDRIKELAAEVDGQSVVITFDPHPREFLKPDDLTPRLLTTLDEKLHLLREAGIDHVAVVPFTEKFRQLTAEQYLRDFLVARFQPAAIVIGYDHRFGYDRQGDLAFLQRRAADYGYTVEEIDRQLVDDLTVSSTEIRAAVRAGEVARAATLLGHSYPLGGTVVAGRKVGRTIGFPTANLYVDNPRKIVPPQGIYAVRARLGAARYDGMLYIGDRPTLNDGNEQTVEVNLFDFRENIYDRRLDVEFVDFIRPDAAFTDLEGLREQLQEDAAAARRILAADPAGSLSPHGSESGDTAIVILNFNGAAWLRKFLPTVLAYLDPGCRVVVADNASTDESVSLLDTEFPAVELLVMDRNHGYAGGYNEALKLVKATTYVLLNSDVEVTPGWLTPGLELLANRHDVGACQPKILSFDRRDRFEYAGAAGGWIDALGYPFCRGRVFGYTEQDKGQYDVAEEIFWATGAALFIRAEVFHTLGGFEAEYFAHAEEIDLCWRMKRAGYRVCALPQSVVYHVGGGTLHYDTPGKTYLNFRNTLATGFKNEPRLRLLWWLPTRLGLDFLAGALFLFQGKWPHIWAIVRAHWHFFPRIGFWWRRRIERRRRIEAARIGPDRSGVGRLSGSVVMKHYLLRYSKFSELGAPALPLSGNEVAISHRKSETI
ncbi:MAG: bifunctional riboflavin kinase/FAD synthetase [Saprospiraceae bacterium]